MRSADSLLEVLSEITGTGSFCSVGDSPFFLPALEVDGIGEIAFPIPPSQARELVKIAEEAPYGRGEQTLHDKSVRDCWQIDAKDFRFSAPVWQKHLKCLVERVKEDLGIEGKVSAHPYKLLLYGKGGHFRPHRDTEKLDAMFGTLIVALPSAHEGGELRVCHGGAEVVVDFSDGEKWRQFQHAAFFADCEHEVEPVRSGYRCCVVYNLRLDRGDPKDLNRAVEANAALLAKPLAEIGRERAGKLTAILLDHAYTEANLSIANLKGYDASRGRALLAAAGKADMIAHLGLVTCHQFGDLEIDGYGGYWEGEGGGGDDTMGEIHDQSLSIGSWRTAADEVAALGSYDIEEEDLITSTPFDDDEPDEKESEGFTGNAGCTVEYWYRRAAVVLWRAEDDEEIRCGYDFAGACRELLSLAHKGGKGEKFQRLAAAAVEMLPGNIPDSRFRLRDGDVDEGAVALVLRALARVGAGEQLGNLVANLPDHAWLFCGSSTWSELLKSFGPETFRHLAERLMKENDDVTRTALFQLLAPLAAKAGAGEMTLDIVGHLARLDPLKGPHCRGRADFAEARAMLAASPRIAAPRDVEAAVDFLCADRSLDHLRGVLGPALLKSSRKQRETTVGAKALEIATGLLADEVARPIDPFPDWKRDCPSKLTAIPTFGWPSGRLDPEVKDAFSELRKFMADPTAPQCELRYVEAVRSYIESFIRSQKLDLDTSTNKKGRPYGLVCTKNSESYQRSVSRRAKDEALLKKLRAL